MDKNTRLMYILERLNSKEKVCVKALASLWGIDKRSIQKDFEFLCKHFEERLNKVGDCYSLLRRDVFYDLFEHNYKTSKQFLKFLSMIDSELYDKFKNEHEDLIKALKLDSSAIYQIENTPYEKLKQASLLLLEQLESAIVNQSYLSIVHHKPNDKRWIFYESQPLKILYLEENWYLAVNTLQNYHEENPQSCFRLMRISFIEKVTLSRTEPKKFDNDNVEKLKAESSLALVQTPFSKVQNKSYRVVLKASAFSAVYFKTKQYLKTQRIIKTYENGACLLEFTITNDMEIIILIQQWIPHLKVIEPLRIRDEIVKKMEEFMKAK